MILVKLAGANCISAFFDAITCPVSKSVKRKPPAATDGAGGVTTAAFADRASALKSIKAKERKDGLAR